MLFVFVLKQWCLMHIGLCFRFYFSCFAFCCVFILCLLCLIFPVSLDDPLQRMLISFRSLKKHGRHRQFLFPFILFLIPPLMLFWKNKITIPFNKLSKYSQYSNSFGNVYTSPFQSTRVNRHFIVEVGFMLLNLLLSL